MIKRILALAVLCIILNSCNTGTSVALLTENGVSRGLAQIREKNISNLCYTLSFDIPADKKANVKGEVEMAFNYNGGRRDSLFIIDFKDGTVNKVTAGGEEIDYRFENEHIIINSRFLSSQDNRIGVSFEMSDGSLNRRDEFVYSLSVPDRARTLFPCFDQPGLKGKYTLSLTVPADWKAVTNSPLDNKLENAENNNTKWIFKQSEPLSTYLFAFVAGKFDFTSMEKNGRSVGLYHRETDPLKIAQCDTILSTVFQCIDYMEDYTAVKFPFAKYDLIILPGFQFGGMEHTGATLYNDRTLFLDENAGLEKKMARYSLIAHETAHMWFGDCVTMRWFNDVWTKEVFANYFAALMSARQFPDVDLSMKFAGYMESSFSEDRTPGANPIKQPLENMKDAGLLYGNIIYNKAPIVMNMLGGKCGEKGFQDGIREYLKTFAYSNATWEELVAILDKYCDEDLEKWSRQWIFTAGIPVIEYDAETIPNFDTLYYGYYKMDEAMAEKVEQNIIENYPAPTKAYALISLNENVEEGNVPPLPYLEFLHKYLLEETDPLLYSQAAGYFYDCYFKKIYRETEYLGFNVDEIIWDLMEKKGNSMDSTAEQCSRCILSLMKSCAYSHETTSRLFNIFAYSPMMYNIHLSESDLTSLSYELAVRMGDKCDEILSLQRSRIANKDRLESFDFISKATSPDEKVRDSVFNSLLNVENRHIEPWASQALALLNHKLRYDSSIKYIKPGLEILSEIQQTGDIFFPKNWTSALLSSYKTDEAKHIILEFIKNDDCSDMLKSKVRMVSDL